MRAIVTCSCGSTPSTAQIQFKLLYPDDPVPTVYISKKAYSLLETLSQDSEVHRFLSSVLKKRGRYAYLLDWDDTGRLNEVYNFMTKKKVQ